MGSRLADSVNSDEKFDLADGKFDASTFSAAAFGP